MLCKVVFKDDNTTKRIDGHIDTSDPNLVKVQTDDGQTVFINKRQIIFIKEIRGM